MSWPCNTCDRRFGSQHAVVQHMNSLDHWKKTRNLTTPPTATTTKSLSADDATTALSAREIALFMRPKTIDSAGIVIGPSPIRTQPDK